MKEHLMQSKMIKEKFNEKKLTQAQINKNVEERDKNKQK